MNITVKKLPSSRVEATVILDDARVAELAEKAVAILGQNVKLKGFRPGHVPPEMLREHIPLDRIHEKVVQEEMPVIMEEIIAKHSVKPIIRPRVELKALSPMTLVMTLVERPEAKVARRKIKLPKEKESKESPAFAEASAGKKETKEKSIEEKKREEEGKLLELIAEHTKTDLAPELIDDEAEGIIEQHAHKLSQHGISFEDWLTSQKKSVQDLLAELRPDAEKRLKIRYGVAELIKELSVDVTDAEMEQAIDQLLLPLKDVSHEDLRTLYQKGGRAYEQFREQKKVEKLLSMLRE